MHQIYNNVMEDNERLTKKKKTSSAKKFWHTILYTLQVLDKSNRAAYKEATKCRRAMDQEGMVCLKRDVPLMRSPNDQPVLWIRPNDQPVWIV